MVSPIFFGGRKIHDHLEKSQGGHLPHPVMLAPMAGITEKAFRIFMRKHGAPCVTTELISADAYVHGSRRTKEMLTLHECELPCGIQIFGGNPEHLCKIAKHAETAGASFVDINFGCPVAKVTKSGAGSGALRDLPALNRLLETVRKVVSIPLSIKIRTGWDDQSIVTQDVIHIAHEQGIDWVTIHGRTREQGYRGQCDWQHINRVAANSPLPIIGNGDLKDVRNIVSILNQQNTDGVMIGRAALANPLIFTEIAEMMSEEKKAKADCVPSRKVTCLELINDFNDILIDHAHPKTQLIRLKKMAVWLSTGDKNSALFRSNLMRDANDTSSVLSKCTEFFDSNAYPTEPTELSFLKGGQG